MEKNLKLEAQVNIQFLEDSGIILTNTSKSHKFTLVWLGGLGSYPQKYLALFLSEQLIGLLEDFKIYIPALPKYWVEVSKGTVNAWFNVKIRNLKLPFDEQFSREDILNSSKYVRDILKSEADILDGDYGRLFLGGFSQGCCMALQAGFGLEKPLAALIGWSGYYLVEASDYRDEKNVLIIHGTKDKVRPLEEVMISYEKLKNKEDIRFEIVEGMDHEHTDDGTRAFVYNFIRDVTLNINKVS